MVVIIDTFLLPKASGFQKDFITNIFKVSSIKEALKELGGCKGIFMAIMDTFLLPKASVYQKDFITNIFKVSWIKEPWRS